MAKFKASRHLKLFTRHSRLIAEMIPVGIILSAATYFVTGSLPLYINGKLDHSSTFSAHVHGTPLPYAHIYCFGAPLSCSTFMDWWAFGLNCAIWTIVAALGWYLLTKKRSHHKH
jgi:hypothetical protein